MTTIRIWAATGLLLAGLASGSAHAQSTKFTFVNNTAFTVYSVHVWPAVRSYWGLDQLGDNIIPSGALYDFEPDDDTCTYNIRVKLEDSNLAKQWNRINLCRLNTLTLHYNYLNRTLWVSED